MYSCESTFRIFAFKETNIMRFVKEELFYFCNTCCYQPFLVTAGLSAYLWHVIFHMGITLDNLSPDIKRHQFEK